MDESNEDWVSLLEELKDDPMYAIDQCRSGLFSARATHREWIAVVIAFIVAFVQRLSKNDGEVETFRNDRFWGGLKPRSGDLHIYAARYILQAKDSKGAAYERARVYGNAAKAFTSQNVEPETVREKLAETTLEDLLSGDDAAYDDHSLIEPGTRLAGSRPTVRQFRGGRSNDDEVSEGGAETEDDGDVADSDAVDGPFGEAGHKTKDRPLANGAFQKRVTKKYPFDENREIAFTHGVHGDEVYELEYLDEIWVKVRRVRDKDSWRQYLITETKLEKPLLH